MRSGGGWTVTSGSSSSRRLNLAGRLRLDGGATSNRLGEFPEGSLTPPTRHARRRTARVRTKCSTSPKSLLRGRPRRRLGHVDPLGCAEGRRGALADVGLQGSRPARANGQRGPVDRVPESGALHIGSSAAPRSRSLPGRSPRSALCFSVADEVVGIPRTSSAGFGTSAARGSAFYICRELRRRQFEPARSVPHECSHTVAPRERRATRGGSGTTCESLPRMLRCGRRQGPSRRPRRLVQACPGRGPGRICARDQYPGGGASS